MKRLAEQVEQPYLMVFKAGKGYVVRIDTQGQFGPDGYGLLICDLVRHGARAFGCDEQLIWDWVEKERDNPTARLEGGKPS